MKRILQILVALVLCSASSYAQAGKEKSAVFDARHELKVVVPEGAKKVRVWFAVPQDDPAQKVSDIKVVSPFPHRIERDKTEGSRFLYEEFTIVTTFRLERREVLNDLKRAKTMQLSESEKRQLARFLEPNQHVIIDDRRRVVWSVGRDLLLSPAQDGGLVNAIPKAYIEIDGQVAKEGANGNWLRKLTFREINGAGSSR